MRGKTSRRMTIGGTRGRAAAVLLGACGLTAGAVPGDVRPSLASPQPTLVERGAPADTARALRLLSRATWGARPEDLSAVLREGPERWLERQLHPERIADAGLDARLAAFPAASMPVAELYRHYPPPQAARRRRPRADSTSTPWMGREGGAPSGSAERRRMAGQQGPQRILLDLAGARLARAVHSERQLQEVMADFWFNHFNVFFGKAEDRWLVGDYERSAIRPHVFGRFEDMLAASARHPAMLVYLDNAGSVAPDSTAGGAERDRIARARRRWRAMTPERREAMVRQGRVTPRRAALLSSDEMPGPPRRSRGINENYARELMELHTLGVDGGYTQADVVSVARAFTGWTIDARRSGGGGRDPRFVFRAAQHDAGEKTVLGRRLRGTGEGEGREVLHLLATHPATARHVARKLAERFVADDPPQEVVDRLAAVFLRTGGDLREVTRALFLSPEMYGARPAEAKVKTPFEFVASARRATGAEVGRPQALVQALRGFGHVPFAATAPTGYPASSEEWTNAGAMLGRMNFALALASGRMPGVRPAAVVGPDPASAAVAAVLPGRSAPELVAAIRADLAEQPGLTPRQAAARALGLALGSPQFQKR